MSVVDDEISEDGALAELDRDGIEVELLELRLTGMAATDIAHCLSPYYGRPVSGGERRTRGVGVGNQRAGRLGSDVFDGDAVSGWKPNVAAHLVPVARLPVRTVKSTVVDVPVCPRRK